MTTFTALLWKEWRELRWFLVTGLGIFLIMPLIGAIEGHWIHKLRLDVETTPWVSSFAGVLAVFIAVGSGCRDLSDRVMIFWRSRPISVGRWLAIKYLSGLALVLLLCTLPLLVEIGVNRTYSHFAVDAPILLVWHPFVLMAIYSVAFLMACLVRRVTQAAMLSLVAMLLIYFLPYVLPPLNWLSLNLMLEASERARWGAPYTVPDYIGWLPWNVAYTPAHVHYALGMLAISALSAIAAWLAVRNEWRVTADRKLMYWSIGLAGLLLLWATAYQLGSNLPVQQEMAMPGKNQVARAIIVNGNRALLLTTDNPFTPAYSVAWNLWLIEVAPSGLKVGGATTLPMGIYERYLGRQDAALANDGLHAYLLSWSHIEYAKNQTVDAVRSELLTISLDRGSSPVVHRLNMGVGFIGGGTWSIQHVGNRLYISMGSRLAAVDISDPSTPRKLWDRLWAPWTLAEALQSWSRSEEIQLSLEDFDGLTPHERLETMFRLATSGYYCLDGDVLITTDPYQGALLTYRLALLTDKRALFKIAGRYRATAIEGLVRGITGSWTAQNGKLYSTRRTSLGTIDLTVYDFGDPQYPRRTGHFAAPTSQDWPASAPLPDGRVLVAGTKLYLVGRAHVN